MFLGCAALLLAQPHHHVIFVAYETKRLFSLVFLLSEDCSAMQLKILEPHSGLNVFSLIGKFLSHLQFKILLPEKLMI